MVLGISEEDGRHAGLFEWSYDWLRLPPWATSTEMPKEATVAPVGALPPELLKQVRRSRADQSGLLPTYFSFVDHESNHTDHEAQASCRSSTKAFCSAAKQRKP